MLSKGSISVLGHDVRDEPLQIRSKIAVVPQEGSTIGPLTPWDHVYLTLLARGMSRNQAHERSEKTIERLELTEYRNQPADSLSGGLKQRVRVAMAVATDAELIFLDEPTLGLDAVTRRRIWGVLNEIQKEGRSIEARFRCRSSEGLIGGSVRGPSREIRGMSGAKQFRAAVVIGYMLSITWLRRNLLSLVWLFATPFSLLFIITVTTGGRSFV